jgi:integrase/recombinase XerD
MRVVTARSSGVVSSVVLLDRDGAAAAPVCRFLQHILDSGGSPNTAAAYAFDLKILFEFLDETGTNW